MARQNQTHESRLAMRFTNFGRISFFREACLISRFYFDLTNGTDTLRDDDGVEANGLDDAIRQTRTVLDEIRDDKTVSILDGGWQLLIRDESGATVMSLAVTETSPITPRDPSRSKAHSNDNKEVSEAMRS